MNYPIRICIIQKKIQYSYYGYISMDGKENGNHRENKLNNKLQPHMVTKNNPCINNTYQKKVKIL